MTESLLDRVVAASGLAPLIAPFAVRRLLVRARVIPDELTPETLASALPELEEGLGVYLTEEEVARAVERLRELAGGDPPKSEAA